MLDKFPAIGEKNTLIVQPFGGNIYLFINEAMKIGVGVHEHELNHEGAAILKRCTGLKSIREIIDEICVEYDDIPSAVEPKVVDFLGIAQEKGYVSIQNTPIPAKGLIKGTVDHITPYNPIHYLYTLYLDSSLVSLRATSRSRTPSLSLSQM